MMCHNNDADPATRKAIRRAGMMGIRGIIRKNRLRRFTGEKNQVFLAQILQNSKRKKKIFSFF